MYGCSEMTVSHVTQTNWQNPLLCTRMALTATNTMTAGFPFTLATHTSTHYIHVTQDILNEAGLEAGKFAKKTKQKYRGLYIHIGVTPMQTHLQWAPHFKCLCCSIISHMVLPRDILWSVLQYQSFCSAWSRPQGGIILLAEHTMTCGASFFNLMRYVKGSSDWGLWCFYTLIWLITQR